MTRAGVYEILDGDGKRADVYGKVMTVLIGASLVPLCFWEDSIILDVIEIVCVLFFIADYIARWATADYRLGKGGLSFVIYPFTPMAIVDLVSILPAFFSLNPAWRTLRMLRLVRALRAFKLIRYSKSVDAIVSTFVRKRHMLMVVVAFAAAYIFLSAMVMFNVEHDTFQTFFDALYWSVVSLTTVGYGDLYPVSDIGRVMAMLSAFVGIAIVAMPASIITAGLMERLEEEDGNSVSEVEEDSARSQAERHQEGRRRIRRRQVRGRIGEYPGTGHAARERPRHGHIVRKARKS